MNAKEADKILLKLSDDCVGNREIMQKYSIKTYTSYNEIDVRGFCSLVEDGFACEQGTKRLVDNYFNIVDIKKIFLAEKDGVYLGAIVLEDTEHSFSYMDKFVTRKEYQKNGIGKKLFETVLKEEKKMCWRAKSDNPVIDFYKKIASGYTISEDWYCFWKALDITEIPNAIDYCLSKEETLVRVAKK
ncbi:MAG: GNAT family N-acetyltransferase [archaeon]|nr:GNAT family N-acetyltransferase [archaeon]